MFGSNDTLPWNPQLHLVPKKLNFVFEFEPKVKEMFIQNFTPRHYAEGKEKGPSQALR